MDAQTRPASEAASEYKIGAWTFVPANNELLRDRDRRALEHRAARTLEALCRRRGQTVSREELIAVVWDGRSLSDNTVPVVISSLRKALDDDHRRPLFIETVAKRGYRLLSEQPPAADRRAANWLEGRRPLFFALWALLILAAGAAAALLVNAGTQTTIVTIKATANQTGDPSYDRVAAAVDGFAAVNLAAAPASILIRDFSDAKSWDMSTRIFRRFGPRTRVYHLSAAIVLDGEAPFLALAAADGRDWSTVWSASIPIKDGVVAAPVREALSGFLSSIERAESTTD